MSSFACDGFCSFHLLSTVHHDLAVQGAVGGTFHILKDSEILGLKTSFSLRYYCLYKVLESESLEKLKRNTKELFCFVSFFLKMFRNFKPKY